MQPPTLTSATKSGSTTTINGTFSGAPNSSYFIEFFNNAACDPSGSGEGQTYIGPLTGTANTNGSGNASFSFATNAPALGDVVTGHRDKSLRRLQHLPVLELPDGRQCGATAGAGAGTGDRDCDGRPSG
jgi:hypothetical protein